MQTIWKYEIHPMISADRETIMMPPGAEILCVQTQMGVPCLWVRVDITVIERMEARHFVVCGTGQANIEGAYIGTFQLYGGELVFHVFELAA